jgi:hypothetical protein
MAAALPRVGRVPTSAAVARPADDGTESGDLLVTGSGRRLSQNARCHRSLEVALQRRLKGAPAVGRSVRLRGAFDRRAADPDRSCRIGGATRRSPPRARGSSCLPSDRYLGIAAAGVTGLPRRPCRGRNRRHRCGCRRRDQHRGIDATSSKKEIDMGTHRVAGADGCRVNPTNCAEAAAILRSSHRSFGPPARHTGRYGRRVKRRACRSCPMAQGTRARPAPRP